MQEKAKLFAKDAEINLESVLKKLFEITSSRGKKGTDRSGQLGLLQELRSIAAGKSLGAALDIKILFNIVASVFDYNPNLATCMRPELWEQYVWGPGGRFDTRLRCVAVTRRNGQYVNRRVVILLVRYLINIRHRGCTHLPQELSPALSCSYAVLHNLNN